MRWVCLLRAVNVGGRGKVPMAELRRVCTALGLEDVETYIQSGNVVFTPPGTGRDELARRLEEAIADAFGVSTTAILRSGGELAAVVDGHPFGGDTSQTYVTFLARKPPREAVRRVESLDVAPDRVAVAGAHVYLHFPNGLGRSKTPGLVDRSLGVPGTNRNWRTVETLARLAGA
jgi:uncharacterized protein (DUF1697 family)